VWVWALVWVLVWVWVYSRACLIQAATKHLDQSSSCVTHACVTCVSAKSALYP